MHRGLCGHCCCLDWLRNHHRCTRLLSTGQSAQLAHYEIWKFYPSTSEVRAESQQNLILRLAGFCLQLLSQAVCDQHAPSCGASIICSQGWTRVSTVCQTGICWVSGGWSVLSGVETEWLSTCGGSSTAENDEEAFCVNAMQRSHIQHVRHILC